MNGMFLAIDWGTTNRSAFRIDARGIAKETFRDDRGVVAVGRHGFEEEVVAIRSVLGDLPMICAGMVGSNRGWVDVPYLPCPAGLEDLAQALHWRPEGRTAIVPGLSSSSATAIDVMRGEEVQILGALAAGLAPADALLCQPGTHCKWAIARDGRIDRFVTAMTGELFSLLQCRSLLAEQMSGGAVVGEAFRTGVLDAQDGDLLARLFRVRAELVTGSGRIADATSYISGLLIGSDVRARLGSLSEARSVHVLADPALGALYASAIETSGGHATQVNSHAAFVAGITRIWELAS